MESEWLPLVWAAVGFVLGAVVIGFWMGARRSAKYDAEPIAPKLPEVAARLLDELDIFAIVLNRSYSVVFANAMAVEDETVPAELVSSPALRARLDAVFATAEPFTQFAEDDPSEMWIHAFLLDEHFAVVLAEDRSEELRVNAMRRDFIANMSHELKTPVSSLGLLAEAISEATAEPERVASFAKRMVKESRRLAELTNDIIVLSEVQGDPVLQDLTEVDLAQLIREEISEHDTVAHNKGVVIVFSDDEEHPIPEPCSTIGRRQSLATAFANLLSNAIKHSPRDARVGVSLEPDGDWVVIKVADQGEGIDAEHLERIFERFYRVDTARTRDEGGTGLGLSIVRHTMLSHGGSVSVWSKKGVGSTFTLRLPRAGSEFTVDRVLEKKRKKRKSK